MITADILKNICHTMKYERAAVIATLINEKCTIYGIKNIHEFLATIIHESGEFSIKEESLFYTHPQRICDVWPKRFPSLLSALPYIHNPEELANKVYGGRMGNDKPNDGWLYRGSGFIQLTGKDSFQKYADYIHKELSLIPELLRKDDSYAFDSACWEFVIDKKLNGTVDFKYVTKRINGGFNGWDSRVKYYDRCKKYIG